MMNATRNADSVVSRRDACSSSTRFPTDDLTAMIPGSDIREDEYTSLVVLSIATGELILVPLLRQ